LAGLALASCRGESASLRAALDMPPSVRAAATQQNRLGAPLLWCLREAVRLCLLWATYRLCGVDGTSPVPLALCGCMHEHRGVGCYAKGCCCCLCFRVGLFSRQQIGSGLACCLCGRVECAPWCVQCALAEQWCASGTILAPTRPSSRFRIVLSCVAAL
jgi:hypothetical protein